MKITAIWFFLFLLLPISLLATGKPNVLFISIDDLNDFPTFAGRYPDAKTPHMDRLAEQGIVFTNAHCQFPVCGPSRASVMAGLLPFTLGFDNHMKDLQLQERAAERGTKLLHSYFSDYGYKTLAVGKICHHHVPEGSVDESGGGLRDLNSPDILFAERLRLNWHQNKTYSDWGAAPESDDGLIDYHIAKWAVEKLGEKQEEPFFLMVGTALPHSPWYVPQKWFDLYERDSIQLPKYDPNDFDDVPETAKRLNIQTPMPKTDWAIENDQWRNILHAYLACVSYVDDQVGKVLKALETSPYAENTIVVLWSDHGYHMGEKNTFQKHTLWERSSHVPLVFAGPGIEAGQRSDRVVSLLDLYPTLLDLCDLPENPSNEGRSIVPLIEDPTKEWPFPAVMGWVENSFAITTERYRYIRYEDGSEELYDQKNDLDEIRNLASDPSSSKIKGEMALTLKTTISQTSD